jgi:hypothetical protein
MYTISIHQRLRHRARRREALKILYRQSLQLRINLELDQNRSINLPRLLECLIQVRRSIRAKSRTAVRLRNGDSVETREV